MLIKVARLVVFVLVFFTVSTAYSFDLGVPYFPQNDPNWGNEPMGCSGMFIRNKGCLITSFAMVIDYFTPNYTNPKKFNNWLRSHNGYDNACNYIWGSAQTYTRDAITGDSLIGYFNDEEATKRLEKRQPVIVKVRNEITTGHFVVLNGKENNKYSINDPGFPEKFLDAYTPLKMVLCNGDLSHIPPIIHVFSVTPNSLVLGNSINISYTISDDAGLKQIELWRA